MKKFYLRCKKYRGVNFAEENSARIASWSFEVDHFAYLEIILEKLTIAQGAFRIVLSPLELFEK